MLNLAKRSVTWDKKELFTRRENESLKSKLIPIVETIEIILSIVQKLARGIAIINRFTDCPRTSIELNFYPTNFVRQFWLIHNVVNIFINWKTNNMQRRLPSFMNILIKNNEFLLHFCHQ